jgi:hypothetical protein
VSDSFELQGSWGTSPLLGNSDAQPTITTPFDELLQLAHKQLNTTDLTVDGATALPFGGVVSAHVIIVKAVGGPVVVRVTSTSGATQSIPVDSFLVIVTQTTAITAVDVARAPGTLTTVTYFFGE